MDLGVDREAVILEALDNLADPPWPFAVQHRAVEALYYLHQLLVVSRLRQRGMADVIIHFHVLVHLPLGHAHPGEIRMVVER